MNNSQPVDLILASASPRRREMLERIGWRIAVCPSHIEEKRRDREPPGPYALRNAVEKARHVAEQRSDGRAGIVIGADTIVVLDDHILEKPVDILNARRMLTVLSGRCHKVITGVCVIGAAPASGRHTVEFSVSTDVEFKTLSDDEIDAYIASGEPMDKAGAYAIQGVGAYMIRRISGSYTNVVGLPLSELVEVLEKDFGVRLPLPQQTAPGSAVRVT